MGCDIHPAVEVRRNGVWRYYRPQEPCSWYNEVYSATQAADWNAKIIANGWKYKQVQAGDRRNTWDRCKTRLPEFFYDRNYRVFAVLGDVRNDEGIDPISQDRGWPNDMDPRTMAKMSKEHSEGWVTLAELQAYDYDQTITEGGILGEKQYQKHAMTGEPPEGWSGGISGRDIVVLEPAQYSALFESPIDLLQSDRKQSLYDSTKSYHIRHRWERKLRDQVGAIPDQIVPYLEKLVPKGGTPDDVRLVFDFDS
jgi:hypothetical protein